MKFTQNTHPTRLFGPTRLIGTWEYSYTLVIIKIAINYLKSYRKKQYNFCAPDFSREMIFIHFIIALKQE